MRRISANFSAMPSFTMSFSSITPRISGPSATTRGVDPARARPSTTPRSSEGALPPSADAQAVTESAAPLRIWRPSTSRPDIRVVAENGTKVCSPVSSRSRRANCSLASTTMERPSGVSSASEASWAASASSCSVWPPTGTKREAMRLPRVIVPVLSKSRVWTSPAASTARPLMARTLRCTSRSMPAMPMAESSAPIVVGIRHTRSETRMTTDTVAPE